MTWTKQAQARLANASKNAKRLQSCWFASMIWRQTKLAWESGAQTESPNAMIADGSDSNSGLARLLLNCWTEVISYRFLNINGPFRARLVEWASGDALMHEPMFKELIGYSTSLVVMQRLESRHSLLKRFLSWRHKQMPATLSAALRRKENQDLKNELFQQNLPELLGSIGELDPGQWSCKTEFLERITRSSAFAVHDQLQSERQVKESFQEQLALTAGHTRGEADEIPELPLLREHLKTVLVKGKCFALKGYAAKGSWSTFRVLNTNPGQNMYVQRACYLSTDDFCHAIFGSFVWKWMADSKVDSSFYILWIGWRLWYIIKIKKTAFRRLRNGKIASPWKWSTSQFLVTGPRKRVM